MKINNIITFLTILDFWIIIKLVRHMWTPPKSFIFEVFILALAFLAIWLFAGLT